MKELKLFICDVPERKIQLKPSIAMLKIKEFICMKRQPIFLIDFVNSFFPAFPQESNSFVYHDSAICALKTKTNRRFQPRDCVISCP
jgi:hypothetical protein